MWGVGAAVLFAVVLGAAVGLADVSQSASRVTVRLFQFRPSQLEAGAGARITWSNEDDIEHTVTSGTPEARDGRFDARLAGQGASASVEFSQAGVYPYFCDRHPSMRGEVRVN